MTNAIKLVPDSDPNADGVWHYVPDSFYMGIPTQDWDITFGAYCPDGHHIVKVTSDLRTELGLRDE